MRKKWMILMCALALSVCCMACGEESAADKDAQTQTEENADGDSAADESTFSLTEEEQDIIDQIGEDLQVISEADYPETVTELNYHTSEFSGQVFQLEGIYTTETFDSEYPYVYRVLNNNGEKTNCGLPLQYVEKDIPEGVWIRVTGIVGSTEIDGVSSTVLDVIAIETLSDAGSAELEWEGSAHQH